MALERGLICLSVAAPDPDQAAAQIAPVAHLADLVEIRLDAMMRPDVQGCLETISLPLLFTNRPVWEGGLWSGDEESRLAPLREAVRSGAAYVDLELRADEHLWQVLLEERTSSSTRLVVSWHDFSGTPPADDLHTVLAAMRKRGADLGKIVTTAENGVDTVRVLALLDTARKWALPLSCFCMGEAGKISRLATLFMGGQMSYVAAGKDQATAPGQLTIREMVQWQRSLMHGD